MNIRVRDICMRVTRAFYMPEEKKGATYEIHSSFEEQRKDTALDH